MDPKLLGEPGEGLEAMSDMPPAPMANNEQCVPVEALAMPDEGEAMVNPEVGDPVTYTVEGKVTRIEGGKAYVMPETVNGKPMEDKANEAPPVDEMAGLEAAAQDKYI